MKNQTHKEYLIELCDRTDQSAGCLDRIYGYRDDAFSSGFGLGLVLTAGFCFCLIWIVEQIEQRRGN